MDKVQLEQEYLTEGKTIYQIAKECGVSVGTIWLRLQKFGIPTKPRGPSPRRISINEMWLRKRYLEEDATLKEIGKEMGWNPQVVARELERIGIPRRKARIRDKKILENYLKSDEFHTTHRLRGALIKLFGKKCQIPDCGYWLFADAHHLEGKGFRDKSGRRHTHNRISGSVLLCPNHHREADNKLISIETLREIIKTRKLKT